MRETVHQMIAAIREFYVGVDMKHTALLELQQCTCGPAYPTQEELGPFTARWTHMYNEYESLAKQILTDEQLFEHCGLIANKKYEQYTID